MKDAISFIGYIVLCILFWIVIIWDVLVLAVGVATGAFIHNIVLAAIPTLIWCITAVLLLLVEKDILMSFLWKILLGNKYSVEETCSHYCKILLHDYDVEVILYGGDHGIRIAKSIGDRCTIHEVVDGYTWTSCVMYHYVLYNKGSRACNCPDMSPILQLKKS